MQSRPYALIAQEQAAAAAQPSPHAFSLSGASSSPANLSLNAGAGHLNLFPEISLLSHFSSLFPQYGNPSQGQPQQHHQQQQQQQQQHGMQQVHHPALEELVGAHSARGANSSGTTMSDDSRGSTAYASRHQAAEQRRRTRINERLDLLRKLVPHTERANTAAFLEEVIKYVDHTKRRVSELEGALHAATRGLVATAVGNANRAGDQRPFTPSDAALAAAAASHQQQQQHSHAQQQQQNNSNLLHASGMHLSLNGGSGGDELLPGLLAPGLPNLRPQPPAQHALFQNSAPQQQQQHVSPKPYPAAFHDSAPAQRRTDHTASRASTLSLSMLGPAPPASQQQQQQQANLGLGLGSYAPAPQGQQASQGLSGGSGAGTSPSLAQQQQQQLQQQLLQAAQAAQARSGSPGSSEESGVPLKKRKVLVL